MKQKTISYEEARKVLDRLGIPEAPPDHPIYSEGPSVTFISRKPKQSKIPSNPTNSHTSDDEE